MSKEQKALNNDRRQFWQMVMATRKESGLSVAAFCKKEGISEAAFYYWRKKLTVANSKQNKRGSRSSSTFIEVAMPKDNPVSLELILSSGHTLRIGSRVDTKTLSSVLSVLRQVDLC